MEPKKEFLEGRLRERRLAFLNDTASFYNENNRGVDNKGNCIYHATETSPGCAIGRWLDPKMAKLFDTKSFDEVEDPGNLSISNKARFNNLPLWMRDLGQDFLKAVQSLHDGPNYWDEEGLVNTGFTIRNAIIEQYNLN